MTAPRMNFSGVSTLVVDADRPFVGILMQMLRGMGFDRLTSTESAEDAREILTKRGFDFCIVEAQLPDSTGAELVRWLRTQDPPKCFIPVLILTGYSFRGTIASVRDAGAHIVVKKPASPTVLFDRISWAANALRPFVELDSYFGPDRRFKFTGPPDGVIRRSTDLPPQIGDAVEPNLSQEEIDSLMKPTRISAE